MKPYIIQRPKKIHTEIYLLSYINICFNNRSEMTLLYVQVAFLQVGDNQLWDGALYL